MRSFLRNKTTLWQLVTTTSLLFANGVLAPAFGENGGLSLSQADRASYKAGPSPLDSPAQTIALRQGPLEIPAPFPAFSLDGEWQMVEGGSDEERLSTPWTNPFKAPVPGSVHTALFQAGVIPHPYIGRNQEIAKLWSFKTYYLKKTFPRPPQGEDETLEFGGICNRCTIWLNGRLLGRHEGMFTTVRYPVRDLLKEENELIVKLDPSVAEWRETVVFNNSFGWMYSKFPPLGIWRSVAIHGESAVKIQAPFVATRHAKNGLVDLVATVSGTQSGWEGKLVGTIGPENFEGESFHFEQEVSSASPDLHLSFAVPNPRLWWPVDLGAPDLYKLKLALLPQGGGRPDVREIIFGIRTIEMAPVNGGPKPDVFDWTFVINGQPMFVKGTGWCTPDAMMDFSRARYDRLLTLAASQHIQMLRAWGCGLVETEDFYDLCNRKGIMVMQEWPTAWNSHEVQPFDLLEQTVREGMLRLRNHPSLVIYTGGNESNKPFGSAIDMMGRLNIELDGTRDFHRGEPFGGSQHDYKFSWADEPMDQTFTMTAVFWGEFGTPSYPCHESVLRFLPEEEKNVWPPTDDGSFAFHTPLFNTSNNGYGRDLQKLTRLANFFTKGATMEQFIIGTQLAHATGVRHALERARARWPESTGALYYKLNDNSPSATWAVVDWYGAPKISYYLIKDSLAPLVAVALFDRVTTFGKPLSVLVFLLDDADALKDGPWEVRVRAYGADLKLIKEMNFSGQGSITKVKPLGEFTLEGGQTKTTPLLMVLDVIRAGIPVQRNYRFTNFVPQDCLFNLPVTDVVMRVEDNKVVVENTGKLPALGVNISRPGHLDTFSADDNYFWLDAGEAKTVKVNSTQGLVLNAWNLGPNSP